MSAVLLSVRGLDVEFVLANGSKLPALTDVSFDVCAGRVVGMVGESGSGKSVAAKSIMQMVPSPGRIAGGQVLFRGRDLVGLPEKRMREIRGKDIAMVFQDPLAVLNPVKTVGWQIEEALIVHGAPRAAARKRALELLHLVGIPDPEQRIDDYPHQFSGGMRQRVVISIALANNASLLIADEPTTALDVTIQAQILKLLLRLREELGIAILLITHDMGVVAEMCDEVVVMYGGRVMEAGSADDVLERAAHPYTSALLRSMPSLDSERGTKLPTIPGMPPNLRDIEPGCRFRQRCAFAHDACVQQPPMIGTGGDAGRAACWLLEKGTAPTLPQHQAEPRAPAAVPSVRTAAAEPLLKVADLRVDLGKPAGFLRPHQPFHAVDGVSLEVAPGETLGLVGESGCGKSTLARTIMGVNRPAEGRIEIDGVDVTTMDDAALKRVRRTIQYVFQDPYASLNPRLTIRQTLEEALSRSDTPPDRIKTRMVELMETVGLGRQHLDNEPHAFSGGQRQRIGIARALSVNPRLLICDEPVSALDISIQAQIINMLADLRNSFGLALLFIAHDLAVVRHLSDRVAVMYLGKIVETGPTEEVFSNPRHPYTRLLLSSIPGESIRSGRAVEVQGELPSPLNPPSGCRFRTRCPIGPLVHRERTICAQQPPKLAGAGAHRTACHLA